MKVSEDIVQQVIQLESPKAGVSLLRNNSGAFKDETGRLVRYGLGNVSKQVNDIFKSSDLIGLTPIVITPDMVNSIIGVFTAVEVKASDWKYKGTKREIAQKNFIDFILKRGGKAGFAKSVEDFKFIIEN